MDLSPVVRTDRGTGSGAGPGNGPGNGPGAALAAALLVAAVATLAVVGWRFHSHTPTLDTWGMDALRIGDDGPAHTIVELLSDGLRAGWMVAAAAALGWLLWRGGRPAMLPAAGYLLLFLTLAALSEILKEVFARPHPSDPTDLSYPSTHVAMVTVAAIIAGAVVALGRGRAGPAMVGLVGVSVVVTAATRVMLGEHHITDVLGTAVGYAGAATLGVWLLGTWTRSATARGRRALTETG